MEDYRDFYIAWRGHGNYKEGKIIVEERVRVVVQKMELCLFTNKGDFMADDEFGCDIEFYLWKTKASAEFIKAVVAEQFNTYIPELQTMNLQLDVYITPKEDSFLDVLVIDIQIEDYPMQVIFRQ